jgi:hypothetical protein
MDICIPKSAINSDALDTELRTALGEIIIGCDYTSGIVTVHLADTATAEAVSTALVIVRAHDASVLTPKQQAEMAVRAIFRKVMSAEFAQGMDADHETAVTEGSSALTMRQLERERELYIAFRYVVSLLPGVQL